MNTPSKTKTTRVFIEGGIKLRNRAKAKAAERNMSLQEFLGKAIEFAVTQDEMVFAADSGQERDNSIQGR